MKTSKRQACRVLVVLLVLTTLVVLPILAPLVSAQSDCAGYECTDASNFDTDDFDGWYGGHATVGGAQDATLEWLETKAVGMWPFQSWADGVLKVTPHAWGMLQKQTYLSPGIYRIVMSGGLDLLNTEALRVSASNGLSFFEMGTFDMGSGFNLFISQPITITEPSPVSFSLSSNHGSPAQTWYFDYIWIVEDISPTPTPAAGTPSATPLAEQATPIPTGTPYCLAPLPTATPTSVHFSLTPSPTPGGPTATPTSLAPAANDWSFLDKFEVGALHQNGLWQITGTGIEVATSVDHSGSDLGGSVFIPNSTVTDTTMIVFNKPDGNFTLPFYLNAWGQAKAVESGATQYVDIWLLDPAYDNGSQIVYFWTRVAQVELSAGRWYAFHNELDAPEGDGYSGQVSALAFSAERADEATSGGIYLDDIFAYGDLENAPYCDGTYPVTRVQYYTGSDGRTSTTGPILPGTTILDWPANKPCPPDYIVPNNFWGPLLFQIGLFVEQMFAFAPAHQPMQLAEMTRGYVGSPIAVYFGIAATFFNLRIPVIAFGIVFMLNIAKVVRGTWMIIKETIPFVG